MTKAADFLSMGLPGLVAQNLGYNNIAITAAGSTSTDATACDAQNSVFVMTATGADGIRMSTSVPLLRPIFVVNTSGSTGKVYPFTGGAFNGGSTDAGISIATQKAVLIMRVSTNVWMIMLGG